MAEIKRKNVLSIDSQLQTFDIISKWEAQGYTDEDFSNIINLIIKAMVSDASHRELRDYYFAMWRRAKAIRLLPKRNSLNYEELDKGEMNDLFDDTNPNEAYKYDGALLRPTLE
jgi:hypothetical protein